VLGLYFNAFHPLIQFFIFINLSLTFIGEAVEEIEWFTGCAGEHRRSWRLSAKPKKIWN